MGFLKEFYQILRVAGYDIDPLTNLNKGPEQFTDEDGCLVYLRDSVIKKRECFPEFTDAQYEDHVMTREEEQYNLYKNVEMAEDLVDLGQGPMAFTLWNNDRGTYDGWDVDQIGGDITFDSESENDLNDDNLDDPDDWLIDDSDDNGSDDSISDDNSYLSESDSDEDSEDEDWQEVDSGPFIFDRNVPEDGISNLWHDILPALEGADINPDRGVFWRHHLDYGNSHRQKAADIDRKTLKQRQYADDVVMYGLNYFERVIFDPTMTHVLAEQTPLEDYYRDKDSRDSRKKKSIKGGLMTPEDRQAFVENERESRMLSPEQRAANEAAAKAETLRRLRERGTLKQRLQDVEDAEDALWDDFSDEEEEDSAKKKRRTTSREARRDQYADDLKRRRRIHSEALPRDIAQQLRKEESAAKASAFDKKAFSPSISTSHFTPQIAKTHDTKAEAEELEKVLKRSKPSSFSAHSRTLNSHEEDKKSPNHPGTVKYAGKTDVDLLSLFHDIPRPSDYTDIYEIDVMQNELESRTTLFYVDGVELLAYPGLTKGRDRLAGLLSVPITLFFIFVAALEHLVVNPSLWVLQQTVYTLKSILPYSFNNIKQLFLAVWRNLSIENLRQLFMRAGINLTFQRVRLLFWLTKGFHFGLFTFAYLRYALWRYVGHPLINVLGETICFPGFYVAETLHEVGEIHYETGSECLLYLKSTAFHSGEQLRYGKGDDRGGGKKDAAEFDFGDIKRTARIKLFEFCAHVFSVWFIQTCVPGCIIFGIGTHIPLMWLDSLTYGLLSIRDHGSLVLIHAGGSDGLSPLEPSFDLARHKSSGPTYQRRIDRPHTLRHPKLHKTLLTQTLQLQSYGGGLQSFDEVLTGRNFSGGKNFWLGPRKDVISTYSMEFGKRGGKGHLRKNRELQGESLPFDRLGIEKPLEEVPAIHPHIRLSGAFKVGLENPVFGQMLKREVLESLHYNKQLNSVFPATQVFSWCDLVYYRLTGKIPKTLSWLEIRAEIAKLEFENKNAEERAAVLAERLRRKESEAHFTYYSKWARLEPHTDTSLADFGDKERGRALWFLRYAETLNHYGDALFQERKINHPLITQHMGTHIVHQGNLDGITQEFDALSYGFGNLLLEGKNLPVSEVTSPLKDRRGVQPITSPHYTDEALLGIRMATPYNLVKAGYFSKTLEVLANRYADQLEQTAADISAMIDEITPLEAQQHESAELNLRRITDLYWLDDVHSEEEIALLKEQMNTAEAALERLNHCEQARSSELSPVFNDIRNQNYYVGNTMEDLSQEFAHRAGMLWYLLEYDSQMFQDKSDTFFLASDLGSTRHDGAVHFAVINQQRKVLTQRFGLMLNITGADHISNGLEHARLGHSYHWRPEGSPIFSDEDTGKAYASAAKAAAVHQIIGEMYAFGNNDILEDRRGKYRPLFSQKGFFSWWSDLNYQMGMEGRLSTYCESEEIFQERGNESLLKYVTPIEDQRATVCEMYYNRPAVRPKKYYLKLWGAHGKINSFYDELFEGFWAKEDPEAHSFITNVVDDSQELLEEIKEQFDEEMSLIHEKHAKIYAERGPEQTKEGIR